MLVKNIFRKEIREILLEYMVKGKITPGVRISLPQLAAELEVSVTPIREALTQLSEIGIVTYIANRGFFVTELSKAEAIEIYEAISLLESEALRSSEFSNDQFRELRTINGSFKNSVKPLLKLKLDMKFHQKLIDGYSNQYLKKIIEDIRIRIFIYEHEYMLLQDSTDSGQMHDEILDSLEAGDIAKAVRKLKSNWKVSITSIVKKYDSDVENTKSRKS